MTRRFAGEALGVRYLRAMQNNLLRVPYGELYGVLRNVLVKRGFEESRARHCAQLFAETTRDGVYSHGLNRFPQFVRMIKSGVVVVNAQPSFVAGFGALERWDGNSGPGNLNAWHCMERAIAISREYGLGCVALANTNHWMRGGSYGWQAAEAGVIGICWSNTMPNLPPWGAADPRVGNNPLIIAVPRSAGHVVLDMAMSQFSYGALANYRMRGEQLPLDGGFDSAGNLTRDPAAIEASQRPLPIGYWKGSGLALLLDMVGAALSGGRATHQIIPEPERETKITQVFLAMDPATVSPSGAPNNIADEIIEHLQLKRSPSEKEVRYPGERILQTRKQNLAEGIPVDPQIWQEVQSL
ncbi:MAG TPA: 3-dehydro-L-gulonate 2-dehydrogenase [Candidatus Dormibacteraeota bacterium]|nr:3-dehydro-L-gulonate 2-dehydrogenase [Candidatus Dormibacteraeota bacterium]